MNKSLWAFPNVELIKISLRIAKPFLKQVVDLVEMGGGMLQGQIKESLWMRNFCLFDIHRFMILRLIHIHYRAIWFLV